MIWQCADCGHQVVYAHRPAACRFCGPDVEFFVSRAKREPNAGRSAGHPGIWGQRLAATSTAK